MNAADVAGRFLCFLSDQLKVRAQRLCLMHPAPEWCKTGHWVLSLFLEGSWNPAHTCIIAVWSMILNVFQPK